MRALRDRLLSRRGLPVLVAIAALVGAGVAVAAGTLGGSGGSPADKRFKALCRERGGTPKLAPGSGDLRAGGLTGARRGRAAPA